MSALAGALAAAIAGAVINGIQQGHANNKNYEIWKEGNKFNWDSMLKQMDWQEKMSNTSMQRMKADMTAAGFNPLLGVTSGGASTPSGSAASSASPPKMEALLGDFTTSAREWSNRLSEQKKRDAEIGMIEGQEKLMEKQGALYDAQKAKTAVDMAVATKGIPAAEIRNDIYDVIRPAVKKTKEWLGTNAKEDPTEKHKREYMKDFNNRVRMNGPR